jgi:hypothetical protein
MLQKRHGCVSAGLTRTAAIPSFLIDITDNDSARGLFPARQ